MGFTSTPLPDHPLPDQLATILERIQRPGDFHASGVRTAPIPRLDVDGVGTLSFPLPAVQAEQLIQTAERAPYGRGDLTLVDTAVRRVWQIPPARIHLADRRWQETLEAIVEEMADGLGVTDPVEASLYKLLIYDQGSFFVEHRDTEKVPGMFATLVVVLPAIHQGGELVVRHAGQEATIRLPADEPSQISYAAFYADCVHELRPVVSGCRLALVYNLVRTGRGVAPSAPDYRGERAAVVTLLQAWGRAGDAPRKLVVALEHHYTPAELSFAALKGPDAAVAGVLRGAAAEADCALHVAMISIAESGSALGSGWEDDDDFEVYEVCDRTQTLTGWRTPQDGPAALSALPYLDDELCPPDALDGEEPDEQHFLEATGNEGGSFERTYRRAALVLWPNARHLEVLNQGGLRVTLPHLQALVDRWEQNGPVAEAETWRQAHTLAGHMIGTWGRGREEDDPAFLRLLVTLRDAPNVLRYLAEVLAENTYSGAQDEAVVASVALVGWNNAAGSLRRVASRSMHSAPSDVVGLLAQLAGQAWRGPSAAGGLRSMAEAVVAALPGSPAPPEVPRWRRTPAPDAVLLQTLLTALARIGDDDLGRRAAAHILASPRLFPLDEVLIPALLGRVDTPVRGSRAFELLVEPVVAALRRRVAVPLLAPGDWTRAAKLRCACADCKAAARFLADPALKTWTLKAVEHRRKHVEAHLGASAQDVSWVTERRSSPHALVLTKNTRSYDLQVAQRQRDLMALPRLTAAQPA